MKCAVCGKNADWDSSYGRPSFIVCGECMHSIAKVTEHGNFGAAVQAILAIGTLKENQKKD